MTSISFNDFAASSYSANLRAPRISFAARLATLQFRQQQAPHLAAIFGVAVRCALAAVPFTGLAVMFVTL